MRCGGRGDSARVNRRGFLRAVGAAVAWSRRQLARAAAPVEASPEAIIRTAIARRRTLAFTYQGFAREAEPHALGTTLAGRRAVLAWQFTGGSHREPPHGWRSLLLAEMHAVRLGDCTFSPRAYSRRDQSGLRDVECDVTASPAAATNPPATGRG